MATEAQTVQLYDTTLRDGMQQEGMSVSVDEKVRIALKLDELGIALHRGRLSRRRTPRTSPSSSAWSARSSSAPSSSPSARRGARASPADADPTLRVLADASPTIVTIVGKTWGLHVDEGAQGQPRREPAHDRRLGRLPARPGQDASSTTPSTSSTATPTTLPTRSTRCAPPPRPAPSSSASATPTAPRCRTTSSASSPRSAPRVSTPLGIHCHNDSDCAVANSLVAVRAGARAGAGHDERLRRALRQRQPRPRSSRRSSSRWACRS